MADNNLKIVSVILAAGKGTRMQTPNTHKVCIPLEGRPVITRAIDTYNRAGINSHFVVVGSMAEQVMQCASAAQGNIFFCFQTEQRGTGNAAKTAAKLLSAMDYQGDVLIAAGDKVIEDAILAGLIEKFYRTDADLAFVTGGIEDFPTSGRVVRSGNTVAGIVEVFDIGRMQLLLALRNITKERIVPAPEAERLALSYLKSEKKAALALGELWEAIKAGDSVTACMINANFCENDFKPRIDGIELTPEMVSSAEEANLSVYLFKAAALYYALDRLTSDNAQQEEYLTDTVGILGSAGYKIETLPVAYPRQVMAFNTPEELKAIQDYIESKKAVIVTEKPKTERKASEWLRSFETADFDSTKYFTRTYGSGSSAIEPKRRMLVSLLKRYINDFGDRTVIITRSPGRVNVMGRHIDHQGGQGNMIAIDRDVHLVAGVRDDRRICLRNMEPLHFHERILDIDELMADYHGQDWLDYVNSPSVKERVASAHGDWAQYFRAAVVRFQAKFPHIKLKGMDVLISGNIPIAAGLSSSSALVVAVTEAIVALNDLDVPPRQFVELCGEAEWYVGTRGGAGDHAAMKFARKGEVVQVGFFPFEVTGSSPFPENHLLVICDSLEKARKTAGAKDVFNHRVACYHIGRELLKKYYPKYAPAIECLRDFNTRTLGVTWAELLRMLKSLPVSMTRAEVESSLPIGFAEKYLSSHSAAVGSYPVRSVVIYGLCECERSRACSDLLAKGEIAEFGKWMNISHNGDRVVTWDKAGNSWPFAVDYSDNAMDALIEKAGSGNPEADASLQPGAYACSIPRIDLMVDIALSVRGTSGAQISGAGLGGCIMAVVHRDYYEAFEAALIRNYYSKFDLEPVIFPCSPVAGSGCIAF